MMDKYIDLVEQLLDADRGHDPGTLFTDAANAIKALHEKCEAGKSTVIEAASALDRWRSLAEKEGDDNLQLRAEVSNLTAERDALRADERAKVIAEASRICELGQVYENWSLTRRLIADLHTPASRAIAEATP